MTTEERAEKLIREWSAVAHHSWLNSIQQQMAREIAREMNTVIAEHNEQCAKVADGYFESTESLSIAKDIRALLTSPAPDDSFSPGQETGGSEGS